MSRLIKMFPKFGLLTSSITFISPFLDNERIIFGKDNNTLNIWNLKLMQCSREIKTVGFPAMAIPFFNDSKILSIEGIGSYLIIRDILERKEWHRFMGLHHGFPTKVRISPDEKIAASIGWNSNIKIWNMKSSYLTSHSDLDPPDPDALDKKIKSIQCLQIFENRDQEIKDIAFFSDGERIISGFANGDLKIFDLKNGDSVTFGYKYDLITCLSLFSKETKVITGLWDKKLKIWDLQTKEPILVLEGHKDHIVGVAVTPDEKRAVSASADKTLKIWDLETGNCLSTLEGHESEITALTMLPNGKKVISGSKSNEILVWDI